MTSPLRRPRDQKNSSAAPPIAATAAAAASSGSEAAAGVVPPNSANQNQNQQQQQRQQQQEQLSLSEIRDQLLSLLDEIEKADSQHLVSSQVKEMFLKPVDEEEVPGYYKTIKNPVDLSSIRKFVQDQFASSSLRASDIYNKLGLMISNALVFNTSSSSKSIKKKNPFRKHAKKVGRIIEKAWDKRKELFATIREDEMEYFPDEAEEDNDEDYNNDDDEIMDDELFADDHDDDDDDQEQQNQNQNVSNNKKKGGGVVLGENVAKTVAALNDEAQVSLEDLRAQYAAFLDQQQIRNKKKSGGGDEDDSDEDDSEDDEEDDEESDDEESDDDDDDSEFENSSSEEEESDN